ncbi:MAG TPA: NAD-dependent epimerase/dehydratase family protein [Gemmatimonadaceae bacterium]|nr:NAD-dependent epimerase/dehydratase family protein [Gemmatimonadaceae bacterium]
MKVLVTGGTGVVGQSTVGELVRRGHTVRLLSRNAKEDVAQWNDGVEAWPASVSEPDAIRGSGDGCDVVVHVAGIVAEDPPDVTFQKVNVEGTANIVAEAERAGVGRIIYVSSLGADTGESPYHISKREAEVRVEKFHGGWIILRIGNVYGPGDEVISLLLQMVRSLPAIPVIDGGDDKFQPLWVGDAAIAIVDSVERPDLHGRALEIAGAETTSTNDLVDRFGAITGRVPLRVPVPGFLASAGAAVAEFVGMPLPVNQSQLTMLREGNLIGDPGDNALTAVFRIKPVLLDEGLKKLADAQLEQMPGDGVGSLMRKRIWSDISGSRLTPEQLFETFRRDFDEATPGLLDAKVEPGTKCQLVKGATITMSLPLRGNVQVRVQEVTPRKATLVTLAGHPLAGAVRFLCEQRGDHVRFETQVYDRPSNIVDWLAMKTLGESLQGLTWVGLVERMVSESGGAASQGVQQEEETLDEEQASLVENWVKELVLSRKRGGSG